MNDHFFKAIVTADKFADYRKTVFENFPSAEAYAAAMVPYRHILKVKAKADGKTIMETMMDCAKDADEAYESWAGLMFLAAGHDLIEEEK
jgi:hypothetical protein